MERNIDSMKYRKSTHLAGVDVETIIAEKGKCILTIKDAFYDNGVDVSGKKIDGYFLSFVEGVKPMCVNSSNRKTIASIVKIKHNCTSQESRNIGNWIGLSIELIFDASVKMKGEIVGGIRINPISPIPNISDENAITALSSSKNKDELLANWGKLTKQEQSLPTVFAKKELLKTKLK